MRAYVPWITTVLVATFGSGAAAATEVANVPDKKPAAGSSKITLKKREQGTLELSNLADEGDDEVLLEGKTDAASEVSASSDESTARTSKQGDRELAGRPQVYDRAENAVEDLHKKEALRDGNPEYVSGAGMGYPSAGVADGGAASGAASGAPSNDRSANGSAAAPIGAAGASGDAIQQTVPAANANVVLPNPRPGTENAMPSDAASADQGALANYADRMVQAATNAKAARSLTAMENPAAARRYLMINRSSYQMGVRK